MVDDEIVVFYPGIRQNQHLDLFRRKKAKLARALSRKLNYLTLVMDLDRTKVSGY